MPATEERGGDALPDLSDTQVIIARMDESLTVLTLLVVPAAYVVGRSFELRRAIVS